MAKRSWKEVTLAERGPGTPRKRDQTSMSTSRDLLSLSGEAIFMTLGQLQRKQMQTDRLPLQNLEIPNSEPLPRGKSITFLFSGVIPELPVHRPE